MAKPAGYWTAENALAEGRKYASRSEFMRGSSQAYLVAKQHGLLDKLYPSKYRDWSNDEDVLAEGRKYASRAEFKKRSKGAFDVARRRNLLDQVHPRINADWSNDEKVLVEGRKYPSRDAFKKGNGAAYENARQRKLLDLIDWPALRPGRDNDAIYIWRAVGQHHNGCPVYKIGVTSSRLGLWRVERVANKAGFEFDLICCEPVTCKATDLERKLHILGEDPGYTGFDGATEFRALSDSALYAAITLICSAITY